MQSKPYARTSELQDCYALARSMRQEDIDEIRYSSGSTPLEALLEGFEVSDKCWSVVWGEKIVAMIGVAQLDGHENTGAPWMLASDDLKKIRKSFLREAMIYLCEMHKLYPTLMNIAWAKNTTHIQWLKWMGFTLGVTLKIGSDQEDFIHFYRRKDV